VDGPAEEVEDADADADAVAVADTIAVSPLGIAGPDINGYK
jgi:hypothetical protein